MQQTIMEAIREADRKHFIHPYTDFSTFKKNGSQIISRANGVTVVDADERQYLDAIAGLWCVNIGHGREEMADAISDQIKEMQYYSPFGDSTNVPAARLAAELADLMPATLNHVFYSSGGSTANDVAIRIVHYYFNQLGKHHKKKIISRLDGYHGSTCFAASLTGIHATKNGFDPIGSDIIHHLSAANMYRRPTDMTEEQYCDFLVDEFEQRIFQLGPDNVAAFIAEPIMGAGGVLIAPTGYHKRMYDICKKYQMLYIADEVVTAFGRLGEWSASDTIYHYVPDILVLAKGITSGYVPLGATLLTSDIYDVISQPQCEHGVFAMGFTYSGHPLASIAALKTIEIMKRESILDNVQVNGPYLQSRAKSLLENDIVGDVRGSHFMLGIELVADRYSKTGFDIATHAAEKVFVACRELGVLVRPIGNIVVISPPLILTKRDCDTMISVLNEAIRTVTPALLRK